MSAEKTLTRSEQTNADITALLRARNPLLWIGTREEVRVERAIIDAASPARYDVVFWDCIGGVVAADGKTIQKISDPGEALKWIEQQRKRTVFVMRDLHKFFDPLVLRHLRNLARSLPGSTREESRAIVLVTPSSDVPPELAAHATVIDYPLPEREEIARILDDVVKALPDTVDKKSVIASRDAAIDAAVGLTAAEAENCYAKSIVTSRKIDPAQIAAEKKRVIAREKVLTWHDPDPRGLDAVGGLEHLKLWLEKRKLGFTAKAREYGLSAPRGVLLVGVAGCGKSLTAKCVATSFGMPLLRLDMGALQSKWIGESQQNIRKALQVAETVAPAVLWVDEIEKALAGATQGAADGGVSADALGTLLTWMQERAAPVFVIATSNDVSALPPELLRKGRFDDIFFVDLPTTKERIEIVKASCAQHKITGINFKLIAGATEGFTGAEIAALVPDAMFAAFADNARKVTDEDLAEAATSVVPLSKTASEKIEKLREWAATRARPTSAPEENGSKKGRNLDI